MNHWLYLIAAGIFEIAFTTLMKLSNGFTIRIYTIGFILCSMISFYLVSKSLATIPLGTAYAVWTGIGAFGTAIIGILFFKDPLSLMRGLFLLLLIGSILGLKWVANE